MTDPPLDVQARRDERLMVLVWPDGRTDRLPFQIVRGNCPCAVCVSEDTGERRVGPAQISPEIAPAAMNLSGNYALKIRWTDGHDTGLFSWELLRSLGNDSLNAEPSSSAQVTGRDSRTEL